MILSFRSRKVEPRSLLAKPELRGAKRFLKRCLSSTLQVHTTQPYERQPRGPRDISPSVAVRPWLIALWFTLSPFPPGWYIMILQRTYGTASEIQRRSMAHNLGVHLRSLGNITSTRSPNWWRRLDANLTWKTCTSVFDSNFHITSSELIWRQIWAEAQLDSHRQYDCISYIRLLITYSGNRSTFGVSVLCPFWCPISDWQASKDTLTLWTIRAIFGGKWYFCGIKPDSSKRRMACLKAWSLYFHFRDH